MLTVPFFAELEKSENILIAGAGGGFDIFSGLPLYFGLREMGKQVHLANLSFSDIHSSTGRRLASSLIEVTATTEGREFYFPELYLSQWFEGQGRKVPIYCFDCTGAKHIIHAYGVLADRLKVDTVILVDGGTDSLMRGDEPGLGTPQEDMASLAAVHKLDIPHKFLVCLGFGVDTYHGVSHAYFLQAVADLIRSKGYLGAWSLTEDMPEVERSLSASEFVRRAMPHSASIVTSSIISALRGEFGDFHETRRTAGATLFINPLMSMYWAFQVDAVVQRNLYIDQIVHTHTYGDLSLAIEKFRATTHTLPWVDLPM